MLTPLQVRVASIVAGLAEAEGFALAGGAALITRGEIQRETRDPDFFGLAPDDVDRLVPAVDRALQEAGLVVRRVQVSPGLCAAIVPGSSRLKLTTPRADAERRGARCRQSPRSLLTGRSARLR